MRPLPSSLALVLLAASSAASEVISLPSLYRELPLNTGGAFTHTAISRLLACDLTGNHTTDLVFRTGSNHLVHAYEPGRRDAMTLLPVDAVDAAVLPGAGRPGANLGPADALVVSTPLGLSTLHFDYNASTIIQVDALALSGWGGATKLCAGWFDTNASGQPRLGAAGVGAGGSLLIANGVAGNPNGPFGGGSLAVPATIFDVCALDWDGDGLDEVALVCDQGIVVVEPASPPVILDSLLISGIESAVCAPVAQAGIAHERLATVLKLVGVADRHLLALDDNYVDASINLGPVDVYDMVSADFGGDGDDDLALAVRDTSTFPSAPIFRNVSNGVPPTQAGQVHFASAPTVWLQSIELMSTDQAADLVVGDFAQDGDPDLGFFHEAIDAFELIENELLDHEDFLIPCDIPRTILTLDENNDLAQLQLTLGHWDPLGALQYPVEIPAAANGVEIAQWVHDVSMNGIWREGQQRFVVDLSALGTNWPRLAPMMFWQGGIDPQLVSHLDVRFVTYSGGVDVGNGVLVETDITRAWPTRTTSFMIYTGVEVALRAILNGYFLGYLLDWQYTLFSTTNLQPQGPIHAGTPPIPTTGFNEIGAGGGPPVPLPKDDCGNPDPPTPPNP